MSDVDFSRLEELMARCDARNAEQAADEAEIRAILKRWENGTPEQRLAAELTWEAWRKGLTTTVTSLQQERARLGGNVIAG